MSARSVRAAAFRTATIVVLLLGSFTAVVWACGPYFADLLTVDSGAPIDAQRYDRGDLGVVKPDFARRYLIQAYRTLSGARQVPLEPPRDPQPDTSTSTPAERWGALSAQVAAARPAAGVPLAPAAITTERRLETFNSFANCLDAAFDNAILTLNARINRYGRESETVADWLRAQDVVFRNCGGTDLVLPPPAPPFADALLRADREYQTAAAYFYATQYEEAARRFREIAADARSPWRAHGRYLAGRAMLRFATVPDDATELVAQRLDAAAVDFSATLADADAAPLHASAQGLLDHIAVRRRPVDRLHELSRELTAPTVSRQDLVDYTWLMDRINLGPFPYRDPAPQLPPDALVDGDDMTAWILAIQGGGNRAAERWLEAPSETWLVAALWTADADHAAVTRLLNAAAAVPATSPAYPTVAFLRVRMLIQRGELDEARRLLADLPNTPTAGFDDETMNLLDAERFSVARTLDDLLAAASRRVVSVRFDDGPRDSVTGTSASTFTKPLWDNDVAAMFNFRLPLETLIAAAESPRLASRLRLRVAQAAFTRAVVLGRTDAGQRAARALRPLAPSMRADLDRYLAAIRDDDRARAATLTLLRSSGLSINVRGMDTDYSYDRVEPARRFGHTYFQNWWCPAEQPPASDSGGLIHGTDQPMPYPPFVTVAERANVEAELTALRALGAPRAFLMSAAIAWGRARPADPLAAEALALSIEGWRWSACDFTAGTKSSLPSRAFALLHRQYPNSEWARRTRYWYD